MFTCAPNTLPSPWLLGMVAVEVSHKRLRPSFDLRSFDYFLIGYIVLNFVTSAATSPEPRMTLRWAALSALAMTPYFLMRVPR